MNIPKRKKFLISLNLWFKLFLKISDSKKKNNRCAGMSLPNSAYLPSFQKQIVTLIKK